MSQKLHVKTGDTVIVISGKDKGKQGKIKAAMPKEGRVVVEGVNMVKRHTKPTQSNPKGGIIEKEAPIYAAKVMIVDPETKKPTRIKKIQQNDGTYVRASVKSGAVLDKA